MLRCVFLFCCAAALTLAVAVQSRAEDDTALADELRLRNAFQSTDNAGLVDFIRQRARGEATKEKLTKLVEGLESKDPGDRQKACSELVAIGLPAVPMLREAARDVDAPEKSAAARRCLNAIDTDGGGLSASAARLLAARRVAGTAEVLLAYLPHAENDAVLEEVKNALTAVTYDKGKADPAVLKALQDPHPLRRASAIVALCQGGIAEPRPALRKLLNDPKPSVRLRASLALAQASDAKAVSTLITLLDELPPESLREVESFLTDLAGELGPKIAIGPDEAGRLKARDAWAKWWLDTEGPGLLDELKKRTLKEVDRDKVLALIEKLGDDDFDVRQQAEKDLVAMGGQGVPLLKQAGKHADLEVRNRAAKCLTLIDKEKPVPLSAVTPRLIALRKPAGAVEAILAYIPFAEDDSIVEDLQSALNAVGFPGGKAHPALLKALDDKVGVRRATAAQALCSGPTGETMPAVRKLLKDKDPLVRQTVALALAQAGEKEAVPTLIALVNDLPSEESGPAEDYLQKLAREAAPKEMPEGDEGRKKRSEMWTAWWKANESKVVMVDRFTSVARERYLGYTLTVQANNNQIVEFGSDGKVRWTMSGLLNPWDAQVLPGNKVLVAEYNGQCVTERDLKGNVLWKKQVASWPMSAERLRNGNTFIVCRNLLVEVDRSGKEVWKLDRPHDVMSARKLPSGQMVIITNNRQVIRMDRAGKEVKSFTIPNVFYNTNEILDNGHIITPMGWMNQVIEYDADGKEVTRFTVNQPNHAFRIPNGNTVVASQNFPYKVVELDKKGKQVGELTTTNYAFRVRRR